MKSQKHNIGELKDLNVRIEKSVVENIMKMSSQTGMKMDDIVVVALKRFISSHCDYLNSSPIEPIFTTTTK